ncbi:MAG TPA: hypothetical protein PLF23_24275 [Candidatus Obscuribacter sp.]|nr:hypothetical protein [Candidatus Obscuribacter sp.]HNH76928.1 hypothetical protein [Candidatus Obscuribacter sp.]
MAMTPKTKNILGGLVIMAAASLMLGHIFEYIAGLTRIISVILTVLAVTWLAVFLLSKLSGKGYKDSKNGKSTSKNSTTDDITDAESRTVED